MTTEVKITPECREFVDRGAKWLDQVYPEWWTRIDVAALNLASACHCVLGQLAWAEGDVDLVALDGSVNNGSVNNGYGRVLDVVRAAGVDDDEWCGDHGFEATEFGYYDALDEAWIDEIKHRWEVGVR